jgi:hypothetical protein
MRLWENRPKAGFQSMPPNNFLLARDPGISDIDSHKPAYHTDLQASFRRHLSEMMDRIAKDWKT